MISVLSIIVLAFGAGAATPYVWFWIDWRRTRKPRAW